MDLVVLTRSEFGVKRVPDTRFSNTDPDPNKITGSGILAAATHIHLYLELKVLKLEHCHSVTPAFIDNLITQVREAAIKVIFLVAVPPKGGRDGGGRG